MHSWLSLSQFFMMFYYSTLWECMLQIPEPLSSYSSYQRWLQPDQTREWNKRVRCVQHLRKALTNPWFRKQVATLVSFILCYKIFGPKIFVIKFIYIYTDDQGISWLVFAFYFTSCYNSGMHYRNLECCNKAVWMFSRDQNVRGNSFKRNE